MALNRWIKIWIVVALCSLLAYDLRWLFGVFTTTFNFLSTGARVSWVRFWVDYVLTGWVGDVIRLLGVCLALFAVYLAWGPKPKPFLSFKKTVALAVLFEGTYFLTVMPITIIEYVRGVAPILMVGFMLQILLVFPVLAVLSSKIWRFTESAKQDVLKWSGIAAVSYLVGIWINNVFRWLSMTEGVGVGFLLSGITMWGFLNSAVILSLSVAFAVWGFYALMKKEDSRQSTRLFAVSLILLGLHFAFFILYSVFANTLNYLFLVEIWPVALLGLGLSMLKE